MPATPDQIPTDLTLEIGENLSPERFMTAARAFFGYVEEVGRQLSPEGDAPKWTVRVREGSALLAVEPPPAALVEALLPIYNRIERGIARIAEGQIDSAELTEGALRHLEALASIARGPQDRIIPLRVWVRRQPVGLDHRIAEVIREDRQTDYNDFGTIEGRLETIQDHRGSLQLQLRDPLLKQKIRCYFPESMLADVFDKFRKRVEIAGVIHYRSNGLPISIEVQTIDALPDDSDLPTPEDVRGILRIA